MLNGLASSIGSTKPFEKFYNLYGPKGRNGKGALFALLRASLGKYLDEIPSSTLCAKQADEKLPSLANKDSVRIAWSTEPDVEKLNEAVIKRIVGERVIQCRNLYQTNRNINNRMTLFIQSNHQIEFKHADDSTYVKLLQIKFPIQFAGIYCFSCLFFVFQFFDL